MASVRDGMTARARTMTGPVAGWRFGTASDGRIDNAAAAGAGELVHGVNWAGVARACMTGGLKM